MDFFIACLREQLNSITEIQLIAASLNFFKKLKNMKIIFTDQGIRVANCALLSTICCNTRM